MKEVNELSLMKDDCIDRKAKVLAAFEELQPGESIIIINNVDPKPLIEFMNQKHSENFDYEYLSKKENEFKIQISKKSGSCCGFCGGH